MNTMTMSQGEADTSTQDKRTVGGFSAVPTTKVLAIARLNAPLTPEQRKAVMPHEVPDTVEKYLDGKIDQWWSRQDGKGPVFLLNVTAIDEAKKLMASLPLAVAGLMACDFIELGPLRPLRLLITEGWAKGGVTSGDER